MIILDISSPFTEQVTDRALVKQISEPTGQDGRVTFGWCLPKSDNDPLIRIRCPRGPGLRKVAFETRDFRLILIHDVLNNGAVDHSADETWCFKPCVTAPLILPVYVMPSMAMGVSLNPGWSYLIILLPFRLCAVWIRGITSMLMIQTVDPTCFLLVLPSLPIFLPLLPHKNTDRSCHFVLVLAQYNHMSLTGVANLIQIHNLYRSIGYDTELGTLAVFMWGFTSFTLPTSVILKCTLNLGRNWT